MNDTGIRPEVIEEIRNLAQKYDIEKVILLVREQEEISEEQVI